MGKEQRTEEIKKILTEVRSVKGKYHSPEISNEEIAHQIYDALFPQGNDSQGFTTKPGGKIDPRDFEGLDFPQGDDRGFRPQETIRMIEAFLTAFRQEKRKEAATQIYNALFTVGYRLLPQGDEKEVKKWIAEAIQTHEEIYHKP